MNGKITARRMVPMVLLAFLAAAAPAFAQTGTEIMQKVYDVPEPAYSHSAVRMELINANGNTETRTLEEWGRERDGLAATVIAFRSPSSVKDTRFLQQENDGRADDRWIYLPALRTVRRVASSEGDKSFMGTDATYDDMETRETGLDDHQLLGEENVGDYACYKVKSTAKDPSSSQYAYRISYVDKNSYVPVKIEMYDKGGDLYKVLTVDKLAQQDGYWIPFVDSMKNVQSGHETRLTIMKVVVDRPIGDRLFSTNFLKTGRI